MARKYAYWISTVLICLLYLASITMYVTMGDKVRQSFVALGYPTYLREILIVVKTLGVVAILSRRSIARAILPMRGCSFTCSSPSRRTSMLAMAVSCPQSWG